MPNVELIDPATIHGGRRGSLLLGACTHLQDALRGAKALKIVPDPAERSAAIIQRYRKAGEKLGIVLTIRRVGKRPFTNERGEPQEEARELYIFIVGAAAKPAGTGIPATLTSPAAVPRPLDTRPPLIVAPARYEPTVLPGVEVSR